MYIDLIGVAYRNYFLNSNTKLNKKSKLCLASLAKDAAAATSIYNEFKKTFKNNAEYIVIDNSKNEWDCFSAISSFIKRSKGEYLIITHDDIRFDTLDSNKLLEQINIILSVDCRAAVFGVAGISKTNHLPVGHFKNKDGNIRWTWGKGSEVESLDECFLLVRNGLGINVSSTLKGFHFYGTDLCINAEKLGYSSHVIDFPITHLSSGRLGNDFFEAKDRFEMHLRDSCKKRFIQTTCTVLYGGKSLIGRISALIDSLRFLERSRHPDLEVARGHIIKRGSKLCGEKLFKLLLALRK